MKPSAEEPIEQGAAEIVDLSPADRYQAAKEAFHEMIARDFADFDLKQYATKKAEEEGVDTSTLSSKIWSQAKSIRQHLDLSGDGKLGIDDAKIAAGRAAAFLRRTKDTVTTTKPGDLAAAADAARSAIVGVGKKVASVDYGGGVSRAAQHVKGAAAGVDAETFKALGRTSAKIGKTAIGVQGIQDRSAAKHIETICEEYADAAEALTDTHRVELNTHIEEFGAFRLVTLHETLGRFLEILAALKQQNKIKEYELLAGIGVDTQTYESMGALDMTVAETLRATAATGVLGAVAVMGTPALVTGAVGAFATASTGTAISTLSGAAATNAILAWLGGGSIAAGGGGMAAGAVVLTGITAGATAGVAILAAGIIVSTHYAKKLTQAKNFEKDTALAVANLENSWVVMNGISRRVDELATVTEELKTRLVPCLDELEALVPVFDANEESHATVFNECGRFVKTMVELAQTRLFNDDGDLSDESLTITTKVKTVLNTEV
ncbi:MAG: hypothetical protein FWF36_04425 [Propionibacteriaceae bacterium]|nr:hypothetical protein [Propionibacteriaceae bacterium]